MSWDVHTPLPCSHPPPVASDKPSGRKVRPTYMYGGSLQTVTLVAKLVGFLWLTLKTILTHLLTMLLEIVECLLLQLSLLWQCKANCNVRQIYVCLSSHSQVLSSACLWPQIPIQRQKRQVTLWTTVRTRMSPLPAPGCAAWGLPHRTSQQPTHRQ